MVSDSIPETPDPLSTNKQRAEIGALVVLARQLIRYICVQWTFKPLHLDRLILSTKNWALIEGWIQKAEYTKIPKAKNDHKAEYMGSGEKCCK